MGTATQPLPLEAFLELPETKPAAEFIKGQISQKPMPQGEHGRLQSKLSAVINQASEARKIAYAFTELRCSFGGDSIIPDIAVFCWYNIFPVKRLGGLRIVFLSRQIGQLKSYRRIRASLKC